MSWLTGSDGHPLDQVSLTGVRARGRHGVLPAERELGQEFVIDVVLHLDTRPAAASDDLAATADYGDLAGRVSGVVAGPPVALLETLAERIADVALAVPPVVAVEVTVHKPQAPVLVLFEDVSVRIRRWQR
ncbi:MAG: dihydroneopterin aldolase [Angustibacter sp.]